MAETCALLKVKRIRLIGLCSSAILLFALLSFDTYPTVSAKPFDEIFPSYGHRDWSSAISHLKSLDTQYNKHSRPRFGKRTVDYSPLKRSNGEFSVASLVANGPISDDWIMVNRALPLSKFSENYLRQLLAQSDRLKAEQESQVQQQQQQQQQLELQSAEN